MKQTDAWDLTCRQPESHAPLRSQPASTGRMQRLDQVAPAPIDLMTNSKLSTTATNSFEPVHTNSRYVVPASSLITNQNIIWNTLSSNEHLQALLATATRAVTLSNTSQCNDLVSPIDWLKMPSKTDLNPKLPLRTPPQDYKGTTLVTGSAEQLKIISSKYTTSEHYGHLAQTLALTAVAHDDHQSGCLFPPCSSSSPVSSSSNSTHSSGSCGNASRIVNGAQSSTNQPTSANESHCHSSSNPLPKINARSRLASSSSESEFTAGVEAGVELTHGRTNLKLDRRARKKDQNRRAAYNYRRKKMEERDRMIEEEARLVHKHVRLAGQIAGLERKITAILSNKTGRILDKDGQIVYYSCPVCLKYCSKDIQTLRKHLKVQHLKPEVFDCSNIGGQSRNCSPTPPNHSRRDSNGVEYDSCIDSDETNDFDVDLHKNYGGKFVIGSNLEADYSTIKKGHSL